MVDTPSRMSGLLNDLPPALQWPVRFMAVVAAGVFVVNEILGDYSQVDRLWSFLPLFYVAHFALLPLWPKSPFLGISPYLPESAAGELTVDYSPRALLMFILTLVWCIRTAHHTYRRGYYTSAGEDYRWPILRQRLPKWFFHLLNLVFIAIIQNVALLVVALPVYEAAKQPNISLEASDYGLFVIGLAVNVINLIADNQQQSFQKYKATGQIGWAGVNIRWTPEDAKRGFVTKGLWAWSRHPNVLCEQLFWIIVNLFPLFSSSYTKFTTDPLSLAVLWDITPALLYCSIPQGSTPLTESISSGKYPGYKAYQQRVSMFLPFLTPVKGLVLQLRGKKAEVDRIVYGDGVIVKKE